MKTDLISRSELFNKLATVPIKAESVETTTEIFKIINSMQTESVDIAESVVERICDGYCKFPQIVHDDNDLDRICDNCPLDNIASARIESGSDLISRADAIGTVRNSEVLLSYDSEWSCDVLAESAIQQTRDCLTHALESLPSAEEPYMFSEAYVEQLRFERDYLQDVVNEHWIPCSERLPENGHYYLWCSDMGSVQCDYYWKGFENGTKYGYNIIAWMPLPKPYREDGE